MNTLGIIIIIAMSAEFALNLIINVLNLMNSSKPVPEEINDIFDTDEYHKSQQYTRHKTFLELITGGFMLIITWVFWLTGGFNYLDLLLREITTQPILLGLIYCLSLLIGSTLISLPFNIFGTFVTEQKFGFNQTTVKTFIGDQIKSLLLTVVLFGLLLSIVLAIFEYSNYAWLVCWIAVTIFTISITFIAPAWIMPLFNKFTPLEKSGLRTKIEDYAANVNFKFKNIFIIDGSKRSSHSNAFFTGFGSTKRIALFDTLVKEHSENEILAILGHEIGHYKLKHIHMSTFIGIITTGIIFFMLSIVIELDTLYQAFGMDYQSVYSGLIFFSFLYTPVQLILSILGQYISRRNEHSADRWACENGQDGNTLISALKKLSAHNLSNLTPHPAYVFFNYSHPPIKQRIELIQNLK